MSDERQSHGKFERWLVPAAIVLFCTAAFYVSTTFRKMPPILKRGIQPSDFPQLVLIFLVGLTLLMAWIDPVRVKDKLQNTVWGTFALFAVFAGLTTVDLFLALSVFALALTYFWGERQPVVLIGVGILVPVAVFFLFDQVFEIRFPRGVLTNLWYG
ncbi:MAG: tripartite tricarboxylate transporter TctB family protein [Rhodobacteraceae bacterium]|nr:tripartite tricarboxylate transporter TctB family protein [Paracoccaceae bacterium]